MHANPAQHRTSHALQPAVPSATMQPVSILLPPPLPSQSGLTSRNAPCSVAASGRESRSCLHASGFYTDSRVKPPRTHRRAEKSFRRHISCNVNRYSEQIDPTQLGGNPRWWEELEPSPTEDDLNQLTAEEVEDRIQEAAAFISVLDDLQPINNGNYNAFAEIWTRISRIPAKSRVHLLEELDQGALRSLWRASMARYVLDDSRAMQLLSDFSVLDDFPKEVGQVATYAGCAERWTIFAPESKFSIDAKLQGRYPRSAPWLKPNQGNMKSIRKSFKQHFFLHPRTGVLWSRLVLPFMGPIDAWWMPVYCKVRPILTLTPLQSDAGADMTFDFGTVDEGPAIGNEPAISEVAVEPKQVMSKEEFLEELEEELYKSLLPDDLPVPGWPAPDRSSQSPFSLTQRDFVRVAGPGVYVGCAYPKDDKGIVLKDACVYFMLVKTSE